jgi:hypothetical protein
MPDTPCESCRAQKQRSSTSGDAAAVAGGPAKKACAAQYEAVERCMRTHNGQINLCKHQWDAFRKCHG